MWPLRLILVSFTLTIATGPAAAETLFGAMAKAYEANPELAEQRANVRARDEDVPKAAAGMRPRANLAINGGSQFSNIRQPAGRAANYDRVFAEERLFGYPRGASVNVSMPVFDGWRTHNSVGQTESAVFAARETLRAVEQETLLDAATAYMNVLHDAAVIKLKRANLAALLEQLRVTRDRLAFGEVTATDLAQARTAHAKALSDLAIAEGSLEISIANYRKVVGDPPARLDPAPDISALLPTSREQALALATTVHPLVKAARHQSDAAESAVKVAEGALLPTAAVNLQVNQQLDSFLGIPGSRQLAAQIGGQLNVPLYQGGSEYAGIRQAKEQRSQARAHVEAQRNAQRAAAIDALTRQKTAQAAITATRVAIRSAEIALKGVRDEAFFGQRTTLDVLNAQQALVEARIDLVTAQRDQVVAAYMILAATGQLSIDRFVFDAPVYDPRAHYEQVKGKLFGVMTPDGL